MWGEGGASDHGGKGTRVTYQGLADAAIGVVNVRGASIIILFLADQLEASAISGLTRPIS